MTILLITVFGNLAELDVFGDVGTSMLESTPLFVLYVLLSVLFQPLEFCLLAMYGAILCERMDRYGAATRMRLLGIGCFLAESLFTLPNTIAWLQWLGIPLQWVNTTIGTTISRAIAIISGIVAALLTPVAIVAFLRLARKLRAAADAGTENQTSVAN